MKAGWRKKILRVLGALVVLALVLLLLLPTILESSWARGRIASAIGASIGADVTLGRLDLGWWGPISAGELSIRNPEGEFAGAEILRLREARIDTGLIALLRGPEAVDVRVTGLDITVDERGAGRTSLDSLLHRHAPAARPPRIPHDAPRPPPPEPVVMPRIRLELADSSVRIRHLAYRPPERRVNPFREDIPVRSVDPDLDVFRLHAVNLELSLDGTDLAAKLSGSVSHGENATTFAADVTIRDGVPDGTIDVADLDLRIIEPFIPGKLRGRVTLRAQGNLAPERLETTVALEIRDFVTDQVSEEWIRADFHLREAADRYALDRINLSSASGEYAVDGSVDFPKDEPYRPSGHLRGTVPLLIVRRFLPHRALPAECRMRFDLASKLEKDGGHAAGTIHLDHFTVAGNENELTLDLDIRGDRAAKRLHIEKFDLHAEYLDLKLRGELRHGTDWTLDATGSVEGDLARVKRIAEHVSKRMSRIGLAGRGKVQLHTLRRKADGTFDVHCAMSVHEFEATGVRPEAIRSNEFRASFDGSLTDAGSTLVVRDARLADLVIRGSVQDLDAPDALPEARVAIKGSVPFSPALARLAGADALRDLAGTADLDLDLRTAGGDATVSGTVNLRDLFFRAGGYEHADPDLDLEASVDWRDERLGGRFELRGKRATVDVKRFEFNPDSKAVEAEGKVTLPDTAPLRELLLDDRWTWRGKHEADVRFSYGAHGTGAMRIRGTVRAPALQFLYDGHGVEGESAEVTTEAAFEDGRWKLIDTTVAVPAR
ncbi:MAG: AsmA family protein, partial [Planctomycetota bacterium]